MPQSALQGIGINYDWIYKADDWKPGMDANLAIANGMMGLRIQSITNAEPAVSVAPDLANAGKCWIVGTTPAAWATGKADYIAIRNGSTASWIFIAPTAAMLNWLNMTTGEFLSYVQGVWTASFTDSGDPFPSQGFQVESYTATPPTPSSPADNGKCWAVMAGATGVWAGKDGMMASWYVPPGLGVAGWRYIQPEKGWRIVAPDVPFTDELAAYGGVTTYRELLVHTGTLWRVDGTIRRTSGPMLTFDLSAAAPGVPYIRVLSMEEAYSPVIVVALAGAGSDITLRYPAAAMLLTPAAIQAAALFVDTAAAVQLDWGDGTEIPGTIGTTGDPGVGNSSGAPSYHFTSNVSDAVITLTPSLGMLGTSTPATLAAMDKADAMPARQLVFAAGNYDLDVPVDVLAGIMDVSAAPDCGGLLYTDEAGANTVTVRSNPRYYSPTSAVIKYSFAQKGAGATTIVLDNTVTGTNNANDILIAIAPATMAVGESRVLRHQPGGGTSGLGDAWVLTYS